MIIYCPLCKGETDEVSLLSEDDPHAEAVEGYECLDESCETQFIIISSKVEKKT